MVIESNPFPIRAHHLKLLEKASLPTLKQVVANHNFEVEIVGFFKPGYPTDVRGKTPKDYTLYTQRMLQHYRNFRRLADEYPALIQASEDGMCNACIVGRHCTELPVDKDVAEENLYTSLFIDTADNNPNLVSKPLIIRRRRTKPDQTVDEITVLTNVGTVKRIAPLMYAKP